MYVCAYQVWEGLGVVKTGRQMLGETDPVSISFFLISVIHHLHRRNLTLAQSEVTTASILEGNLISLSK